MSLLTRRRAAAATPTASDRGSLASKHDLLSLRSADDRPIELLVWSNQTGGAFRYQPEQFLLTLDVARWRATVPTLDAVQLELPAAWVTDRAVWRRCSASTTQIEWLISPKGDSRDYSVRLTIHALASRQRLDSTETTLPIAIHGVSRFDPARHAFSRANNVAGWGVVRPGRDVFDRTFGRALFPNLLFNGLYRSIVFIGGGSQGYGGGLCTGMARAALERSLLPAPEEPEIDQVLRWHGRQLTDRALLASAPWFLVPSPRRAVQSFRRDLIARGRSERCFDIGVPKPWRADILSALQREGHTVVPYAFRESEADLVEVLIYDPNQPEASKNGAAVMTFSRDRNTYQYHDSGGLNDHQTTVIAVKQDAYRRGRTAILAGAASALLAVTSSTRSRLVAILGRREPSTKSTYLLDLLRQPKLIDRVL